MLPELPKSKGGDPDFEKSEDISAQIPLIQADLGSMSQIPFSRMAAPLPAQQTEVFPSASVMANQFDPPSSVSDNLPAPAATRVHRKMRKSCRKLVQWEVTSDHHLPLAIHLSTAPREPNFQIGWAWLSKNFRGELDSSQLSVPISFSAIQWGNLIHAIARHCQTGTFDSASLVFDRRVKAGTQPNPVTYSCLIHGLCNVGTIDEALNIIKEMVEKGLGPTASTYTLPLTSLCEAGHLKEACDCKLGNLNNAMRLLNFMQENGCAPDEWTFTELICGFFKMGTLHVALDMFNKMAACGLNPNKVSYTALIHECCKREAIGLALSLLDKIKEISCRPTVHTYNVIFNGFCTQNRLPEPEKLCTKIAAHGLFPTVVTYTTLIDGLCKSGATSLAFRVVDEMMKHNCLPNHHTYSTVIYGLCQEVNAMEAELLFKEIQRKGLIPDRVTSTSVTDGPYGVLLNGLQKDQDVLEEDHIDGYLSTGKVRGSTTVAGLLDRLLENGCGSYLYVTLLVGLWRKGSRHLSHTCALIKSLIAPSYSDGRTCWSDKVYCKTTGNWYCLATTAVASAALEYGQKHNIRRIVAVRDVSEALLLIYARSDTSRRSICGPHAIRTHDLVDKLPSMFHSIIILKILSRVTMIFV